MSIRNIRQAPQPGGRLPYQLHWLAIVVAAAVLAALGVVAVARASGNDEIASIRSATSAFHHPETAQAQGWDLRPGLDNCFDKPGTGGMGFHLINLEELGKLSEDPLRPEALVYAPGPNGQLQLVAVEYVVPAAPWDAAGNTEPPSLLGQSFHLDPDLGVYELHAWIYKANPLGLFKDFNPNVALCSAS